MTCSRSGFRSIRLVSNQPSPAPLWGRGRGKMGRQCGGTHGPGEVLVPGVALEAISGRWAQAWPAVSRALEPEGSRFESCPPLQRTFHLGFAPVRCRGFEDNHVSGYNYAGTSYGFICSTCGEIRQYYVTEEGTIICEGCHPEAVRLLRERVDQDQQGGDRSPQR
jgi:hypothetical protein